MGESLEASPNYLPATRAGRSVAEFEAQVHRSKGSLILELEDWPDRPKLLTPEIFSSLREMLGQLKGDQTVGRFCQHVATG